MSLYQFWRSMKKMKISEEKEVSETDPFGYGVAPNDNKLQRPEMQFLEEGDPGNDPKNHEVAPIDEKMEPFDEQISNTGIPVPLPVLVMLILI